MRNFADLIKELDETTRTDFKVKALINYFKKAPPGDSAWAVSLLLGRKIKQVIPLKNLRKWSVDFVQIPEWLFTECLENVGDLTETISLILSINPSSENIPLQTWIEQHLIPLRNQKEELQKEKILSTWSLLNSNERYLWNKLVTGNFHHDITPKLLIKSLSEFSGLNETIISYRLTGDWIPSAGFFNLLIEPVVTDYAFIKPYPFNHAVNLDKKVEELGNINLWQAEWKWNGIRSQIIKREIEVFIWSHYEYLLNDPFPELYEIGKLLPEGTALDGIIIPIKNKKPLPLSDIQKRIVNWYPVKKTLSDIPFAFVAFDILEFHKENIRNQSLSQRRTILIKLLNDINIKNMFPSPIIECNSWENLKSVRNDAGNKYADGLILKRLDSTYSLVSDEIANSKVSSELNANWYKWKNDPRTIVAVLFYAGSEKGSMSPLFKEYTFAIWHEGKLVPFTKTSIGLSDEEIGEVDVFVRNNTIERFGPVRTVKPELVFELEFDGIHKSSRHKSGIIVISPRITCWLRDKKIEEAGTLGSLLDILETPKT